jgi:hypothetical protein
MGHSTKGQMGKWKKPKKNYIYCSEKPKAKPHLIEKEIKD